jgi:hypothetical protein
MSLPIKSTWSTGGETETAGTVIRALTPVRKGLRAVLTLLSYSSGGTAHTVTVLRPLGQTTLSAAAAASQAVVNLTADPGAGTVAGGIAANDKVVIEKPDGTLHYGVVSSVATLAVTLTANVPAGGFSAGARVWFYGVNADKHPTFKPPVSAQTTFASESGVVSAERLEQPLIVESDNGTAAGTFGAVEVAYCSAA